MAMATHVLQQAFSHMTVFFSCWKDNLFQVQFSVTPPPPPPHHPGPPFLCESTYNLTDKYACSVVLLASEQSVSQKTFLGIAVFLKLLFGLEDVNNTVVQKVHWARSASIRDIYLAVVENDRARQTVLITYWCLFSSVVLAKAKEKKGLLPMV